MSLGLAKKEQDIDENFDKDVPLVLAAQAGDKDAYGSLYNKYKGFVYGIVYLKVRSHASADEIAQDVFMIGFNKIHTLREAIKFKGWIGIIANNTALNSLRKHEPINLDLQEDYLPEKRIAYIQDPISSLIFSDVLSQVRSAIALLSPIEQQVIYGYYFQGMSIRDMSKEFGDPDPIPEGTIKSRMDKARHHLRGIILYGTDIDVTDNLQ